LTQPQFAPTMLHSDYYAPHFFSSFALSEDSDISCSCSGEFSASTSMDTLHAMYSHTESVMVHDPYSMAAYRMIPRLSMTSISLSLDSSNNAIALDSDDDGTETECVVEQPKRIRKKKVKCTNGHRCAKRLRYRKGQSHYSCLECQVRWKA